MSAIHLTAMFLSGAAFGASVVAMGLPWQMVTLTTLVPATVLMFVVFAGGIDEDIP